jgi:hypothetical protein
MGAALGLPDCLVGVEYVGPEKVRKSLFYFYSKVDKHDTHAYCLFKIEVQAKKQKMIYI